MDPLLGGGMDIGDQIYPKATVEDAHTKKKSNAIYSFETNNHLGTETEKLYFLSMLHFTLKKVTYSS